MSAELRLALCQMPAGMDKQENVDLALSMLQEAADGGGGLAVLPEMSM